MNDFPVTRMRRLRYNPVLRGMVKETQLSRWDLIQPLFVVPGSNVKREIASMPGCYHLSIDALVEDCKTLWHSGVPAIILFGIPEEKDEVGSDAYSPDGIIQRAVRAIKRAVPELLVITDVCLCEYTAHGHCGVIENGEVQNDPTIDLLAKEALSHVQAGADMVAPSDMMDGRVARIREVLDDAGHSNIPIMSYAAKFASAFYGPFRDAAESAPQFGDRSSYQMNPANGREALREVELDIAEGADILMVKPALPYLDILRTVRVTCNLPLAAYQVSGEFSMIKAAAGQGLVDHDRVMYESLISIKRAGADLILSYFARDIIPRLDQFQS